MRSLNAGLWLKISFQIDANGGRPCVCVCVCVRVRVCVEHLFTKVLLSVIFAGGMAVTS